VATGRGPDRLGRAGSARHPEPGEWNGRRTRHPRSCAPDVEGPAAIMPSPDSIVNIMPWVHDLPIRIARRPETRFDSGHSHIVQLHCCLLVGDDQASKAGHEIRMVGARACPSIGRSAQWEDTRRHAPSTSLRDRAALVLLYRTLGGCTVRAKLGKCLIPLLVLAHIGRFRAFSLACGVTSGIARPCVSCGNAERRQWPPQGRPLPEVCGSSPRGRRACSSASCLSSPSARTAPSSSASP
jgi:hypothetical protein